MAEGARLESVYTFIAYRGFESLSLRQIGYPYDTKRARKAIYIKAFRFFSYPNHSIAFQVIRLF